MSVKQLEGIRREIADVRYRIQAAQAAGLPHATVRSSLEACLSPCLAKVESLKQNMAEAFRRGHRATFDDLVKSDFSRDELATVAIGLALSFYGLDLLLDEAQALAGEADDLRLDDEQRVTELNDLREILYQLELKDAAMTEHLGVDRRPDADPMAALGVPPSVALS